jgi:ribonuclease HI
MPAYQNHATNFASNPEEYVVIHLGASSGVPGPGGCAARLQFLSHGSVVRTEDLWKSEPLTTANRMHLLAAIVGLRAAEGVHDVVVCSPSDYLVNGMTRSITQWAVREWRTASGGPLKHAALWSELRDLSSHHTVEWRLEDDEEVHALARTARDEAARTAPEPVD